MRKLVIVGALAIMVAVVTELADRDFLRRDPDPDDKRRNVITLTEVGRDRLRNLDKLIDSLQEEVLAPLTPAEARVKRVHELRGRRIVGHPETHQDGARPRVPDGPERASSLGNTA